MDSIHDFFHMGGYAAFVWSSYGMAAVLLIVLVAASLRSLNESKRVLEKLQGIPMRRRPDGDGVS